MRQLRFVCAQPANTYYAWQVEVMINNFIKNGVHPNFIDIVCSYPKGTSIPDDWNKLRSTYNYVRFFFYEDERVNPAYVPSVRPHILKKHWKAHPYLSGEAVFYHDCDMVFTKPISWMNELRDDDVWYLSDTRFYIGAKYIKSKKFGVYESMCDIIGIDPSVPEENEENSGGAQYLMKNVTYAFWEKVEEDCETLYKFFLAHLKEHPETKEYHPIQKWTADMWAVLWNAWLLDHETKIVPEMEFVWGTQAIGQWNRLNIFHNAGVLNTQHEKFFYKGRYINKYPYDIKNTFSDKLATSKYVDEIIETAQKSCLVEPTTIQKAKNLAGDIKKNTKSVMNGNSLSVDKEVYEERINICKECEFFVDENKCTKCGCGMKIKANLAASSCPVGKWKEATQNG